MKFLVDMQLPMALAAWLRSDYAQSATHFLELGLDQAPDIEVFSSHREPGIVLVTKDEDFVDLVLRLGMPPQVLWVTCGNSTNNHLQSIFARGFDQALSLLREGEPVVELS